MLIWTPSMLTAPTARSVSALVAASVTLFSSASSTRWSSVLRLVSFRRRVSFDSSSSTRNVGVASTRLSGGSCCASSGTSLSPSGFPQWADR